MSEIIQYTPEILINDKNRPEFPIGKEQKEWEAMMQGFNDAILSYEYTLKRLKKDEQESGSYDLAKAGNVIGLMMVQALDVCMCTKSRQCNKWCRDNKVIRKSPKGEEYWNGLVSEIIEDMSQLDDTAKKLLGKDAHRKFASGFCGEYAMAHTCFNSKFGVRYASVEDDVDDKIDWWIYPNSDGRNTKPWLAAQVKSRQDFLRTKIIPVYFSGRGRNIVLSNETSEAISNLTNEKYSIFHETAEKMARSCSRKYPWALPCLIGIPSGEIIVGEGANNLSRSYDSRIGIPSKQMVLDVQREIEYNIQAREEAA